MAPSRFVEIFDSTEPPYSLDNVSLDDILKDTRYCSSPTTTTATATATTSGAETCSDNAASAPRSLSLASAHSSTASGGASDDGSTTRSRRQRFSIRRFIT